MMNEILPEIDLNLCDGCGECVPACGAGALALSDGKVNLARPDLCEYDGQCEPACPVGAIALPYLIVLSSPLEPAPLSGESA
jgi:NAD-dependent dihydropyrimidine dehydrogenase PreA subunit